MEKKLTVGAATPAIVVLSQKTSNTWIQKSFYSLNIVELLTTEGLFLKGSVWMYMGSLIQYTVPWHREVLLHYFAPQSNLKRPVSFSELEANIYFTDLDYH